jgi:hypothetical protein
MKMILDAEEKFAYDESLSNFIMLKIWHDIGIDVSNFSEYIAQPSGYSLDEPGPEILEQGLKALFSDYEYLDYEELERMEEISHSCDMKYTPEYLYILNSDKVQTLIDTGEIKKLEKLLSNIEGDLTEFEVTYHADYGLLFSIYCPGLLFELAQCIASISREIDSLYQKLEGVISHGFYRKAV